ncbi:peptide ABC transporter substrate-binding protein, partial [Corynebacterium striatum]
MNLKKTLAFLAVATASVSLAACGSSDNGGSSDGIVLANGAEPQNPLIPANTNENGGGRLTKLIYAGLVYYDNAGKTHMDVAESIEPNKDNTVFTVKLKDTKFSDGSPVTSKDFVDTWNYAVEKNFNNAYFFEMIKGYKEGAKSMEGLKVIDDSTFTIELAAPDADFVSRLGYDAYFPMHESAFADIDGYGENPIGNGPYMLDSWNHNVDATVVKNPEYTGERTAQNEGVKFTFYAQGDAAYADLLSGNLDVLDAIPDSAFSTYEQELAGRSTSDASARQVALTLNENLDHFSGEEGKLRRQAISHA